MADSTKARTLEKLNNIEKKIELILEELKETKSLVQKKTFGSLCGILKGIKISERDIKEAKKSLFKTDLEL